MILFTTTDKKTIKHLMSLIEKGIFLPTFMLQVKHEQTTAPAIVDTKGGSDNAQR